MSMLTYTTVLGESEENRLLGGLDIDGRTILILMPDKQSASVWAGFV